MPTVPKPRTRTPARRAEDHGSSSNYEVAALQRRLDEMEAEKQQKILKEIEDLKSIKGKPVETLDKKTFSLSTQTSITIVIAIVGGVFALNTYETNKSKVTDMLNSRVTSLEQAQDNSKTLPTKIIEIDNRVTKNSDSVAKNAKELDELKNLYTALQSQVTYFVNKQTQ